MLQFINCASTKEVANPGSLIYVEEGKKTFIQVSLVGIHLVGVDQFGIAGKTGFKNSMEYVFDTVKSKKSNRYEIIHKETSRFYLVYFPFSLIFTPVTTEFLIVLNQ